MKRFLLSLVMVVGLLVSIPPSTNAENFSCLQPPDTVGTVPSWSTSTDKDLKYVVSWAFKDPENCIVGIYKSFSSEAYFRALGGSSLANLPAKWRVTRDGEMALVSAEVEFPLTLLQSFNRIDNSTSEYYFSEFNESFKINGWLEVKGNAGKQLFMMGNYSLRKLWLDWFSKNQGIYPERCTPNSDLPKIELDWKITKYGTNPNIEIGLSHKANCIFLVHAGPLGAYRLPTLIDGWAFWDTPGAKYFKSILQNPQEIIQIGVGDFIDKGEWNSNSVAYGSKVTGLLNAGPLAISRIPDQILSHTDLIERIDNSIKINTTIDASKVNLSTNDVVTVLLGVYSLNFSGGSYSPSGWRISHSGNTWTARYSKGGSLPPGNRTQYQNIAIKIPISDLLISPQQKAAAELKAKQEAEAKAAAALKIKQEAEVAAKAAAELKAKLEAEAKAAAELKAKQETEVKAALELKAKQEAEAKAAAELKAKQEAEVKAAAMKKTTITCVKGKLIKKVTAVKPKCPAGYKVKK
jgi:hypothetical protein